MHVVRKVDYLCCQYSAYDLVLSLDDNKSFVFVFVFVIKEWVILSRMLSMFIAGTRHIASDVIECDVMET